MFACVSAEFFTGIDEQMILISASLCIDIDEQIYESLSVSSWVYTGHVSALYNTKPIDYINDLY